MDIRNLTYEEAAKRFADAKKRKQRHVDTLVAYLQEVHEKETGVKNVDVCVW